VAASAAVAGVAVVRVLFNQSTHRAKLGAILDAVIDDSFTREWWGALARKDVPALKRLLARPEFGRMTSRDLSSLADGLADLQSGNREILVEVLRTAYDRFPSEFWVNFRLASTRGQGGSRGPGAQAETIRYLSAAVAARPRSAIARVALGAELWEKRKGDPAGLRMIRSAAELDPTSVWPHIVIGYIALENRNWDEAFQAYRKAIEADPDTGFFMTHTFLLMVTQFEDRAHPPDVELAQFLDDLVAAHPNHPGGYDLRGEFRFKKGDSRAALADYRAAKTHMRANYPRRNFITMQLDSLEPQARWENQLPAVLRGEVRPTAAELTELAGYCAGFEKKYGLAARFAAEALADNPHLSERQWPQVAKFAGWAIQAGMGKGADSTAVPLIVREHYRRLALQWIRDIIEQRGPAAATASFYLNSIPEFAPVRDAKELARLPVDERQAWEKLWAKIRTPANAPPPHEKKK
jgi:eukaryotic-like serine/threonine-protein kinase